MWVRWRGVSPEEQVWTWWQQNRVKSVIKWLERLQRQGVWHIKYGSRIFFFYFLSFTLVGQHPLLAGADIIDPLPSNSVQTLAGETESKAAKKNHGTVYGTSDCICWSTTASLWPWISVAWGWGSFPLLSQHPSGQTHEQWHQTWTLSIPQPIGIIWIFNWIQIGIFIMIYDICFI